MQEQWRAFATVDPFDGMTPESPGIMQNLAGGEWQDVPAYREDIVDPLNGGHFLDVPDTSDLAEFAAGLASCPKTGLHNPLKRNDRYVHLGRVCAKAATLLAEEDVERYFTKLTQRVMPKSWQQCLNEVVVTRVFLENFAGDGVRFLARGFSNPGDHEGQESRGYRWPFGPVVVIAPFNFPLEIPALQTLGALFMGNRPLVKVDSKVSVVYEQFLRMLIHCGLDPADIRIVGSPQSDVYTRPLKASREELLAHYGFPTDRKLVVYATGALGHYPDEYRYPVALAEAELRLESVERVVISHFHVDHCLDLCRRGRWRDAGGVGESPVLDNALVIEDPPLKAE